MILGGWCALLHYVVTVLDLSEIRIDPYQLVLLVSALHLGHEREWTKKVAKGCHHTTPHHIAHTATHVLLHHQHLRPRIVSSMICVASSPSKHSIRLHRRGSFSGERRSTKVGGGSCAAALIEIEIFTFCGEILDLYTSVDSEAVTSCLDLWMTNTWCISNKMCVLLSSPQPGTRHAQIDSAACSSNNNPS